MYERYKPLRNRLRGFNLWSGLCSVFAYSQFVHGDMALPDQLYTPRLRNADKPWQAGLFPWDLELLARELILNGQHRGGTPLADGPAVFDILTMIHRLEDSVWGDYPDRQDDIMLEMSRIAYRQFPWQTGVTTADVARYYMMFRQPALASAIEAEFELSIVEFFQLILMVKEEMTHQPMLQMAFARLAEPSVLPALNAIAARLGRSLDEMRAIVAEGQSYDINWAYSFNPLRETPLVHAGHEATMLCPIPLLFTRRLTEGVYYDLIRRGDDALSLFGYAFEAYVGEAARAELGARATILGDVAYGRPEKRSIDWIVSDASATLFVECKLARPDLKAQTEISARDPLGAALKRLGDAVAQSYATLADALNGDYPHWEHDSRPIYPIVVTLSNWYAFGPHFMRLLQAHIDEGFVNRGLDHELLDRHPFTICSVAELEVLLAVLRTVSIGIVMAGKTAGEAREWMLQPYLAAHHAEAARRERALFDDKIDTIIYGPSRFTRVRARG